jgi:hypothetical protein
MLAMAPTAAHFEHIAWGVLIVDVIMLAAVLALALSSTRYWPLWMAALQLLQVMSHFSRMLPGMIALTYAIAMSLIGYPIALLLAIAAWRHRQRTRMLGPESSWKI